MDFHDRMKESVSRGLFNGEQANFPMPSSTNLKSNKRGERERDRGRVEKGR